VVIADTPGFGLSEAPADGYANFGEVSAPGSWKSSRASAPIVWI
jgi:hypothetical protein